MEVKNRRKKVRRRNRSKSRRSRGEMLLIYKRILV